MSNIQTHVDRRQLLERWFELGNGGFEFVMNIWVNEHDRMDVWSHLWMGFSGSAITLHFLEIR